MVERTVDGSGWVNKGSDSGCDGNGSVVVMPRVVMVVVLGYWDGF